MVGHDTKIIYTEIKKSQPNRIPGIIRYGLISVENFAGKFMITTVVQQSAGRNKRISVAHAMITVMRIVHHRSKIGIGPGMISTIKYKVKHADPPAYFLVPAKERWQTRLDKNDYSCVLL